MSCSNLPRETVPRESVELIKTTVTRGTPPVPVDDYELTLAPLMARPVTGWAAPASAGSDKGYLTPGDLDPGQYVLWARATAGTEVAVIPVLHLDIT